MTKISDCVGCNTESICSVSNVKGDEIDYTEKRKECPCTICIVKVVCGNPCEEYKTLWRRVFWNNKVFSPQAYKYMK